MNNFHHTPVLLTETIHALRIKKDGKYIDATLGGGGHAQEIIQKGGKVLGIDRDEDAIEHARIKFGNKIIIARDSFANIKKIARGKDFLNANGILLDLGVSSHQLDTPGRGFSYRFDAPLDMRMDRSGEKTAADIINGYTFEQLEDVFARYGELEEAEQIAKAIIEERKKKKIYTTTELMQAIAKKIAIENSTKSQIFQSLRIETNDEIRILKEVLQDTFDILQSGGRLCVISFHSLEDRITKEFGKKIERERIGKVITKKPTTPTQEEIQKNRRSKSSKLRVIEKL